METFARFGLLGFVLAACAVPEQRVGPGSVDAFDWTHGVWRGHRRDEASGTQAPMEMRVEPLRTGVGQIRWLEIVSSEGRSYRGATVLTMDAESGRWGWQYSNSTKRRFSRYEGAVGSERRIWESRTPGRKRESRLVSEQLANGGWRRTMSISTDAGKSYEVIWTDTLRKVPRAR